MSDAQLPSDELLPCPFCAGHAKLNYSHDGHEEGPPYYVTCDKCESDGAWKDTAIEARTAWNQRTP